MNYCYTPIDSPSFFYADGDCGTVNHDLKVKKGDLQSNNQIISAVLIQLNTDKLFDGKRGFWGDEFIGFPIGNHVWRLPEIKENKPAMAESMLIEALDPLVRQGLIDDVRIETVRVVGGIEATVTISKDGQSIFEVVV